MTTHENPTVVRREVVVDASPERAFAVFTDDFGAVKPREHTLLPGPVAETVLEPWVGGRILDRADDGTECVWARVLVVEAPTRLVFTWDITPTWQVETDPSRASEVEVRFVGLDDGRTRVELEHRHLDRHGPGWEAVRDGVDDDQGWPLYLQRYTAAVSAA